MKREREKSIEIRKDEGRAHKRRKNHEREKEKKIEEIEQNAEV